MKTRSNTTFTTGCYTHHYVYLSPDLQQAANRLFYDYAQSLFTPEATNETF